MKKRLPNLEFIKKKNYIIQTNEIKAFYWKEVKLFKIILPWQAKKGKIVKKYFITNIKYALMKK